MLKPTLTDRLVGHLVTYQLEFERIQFYASSTAQDIAMLIAEVKALQQKQEVMRDEYTGDSCFIINDDNNVISGSEGANR